MNDSVVMPLSRHLSLPSARKALTAASTHPHSGGDLFLFALWFQKASLNRTEWDACTLSPPFVHEKDCLKSLLPTRVRLMDDNSLHSLGLVGHHETGSIRVFSDMLQHARGVLEKMEQRCQWQRAKVKVLEHPLVGLFYEAGIDVVGVIQLCLDYLDWCVHCKYSFSDSSYCLACMDPSYYPYAGSYTTKSLWRQRHIEENKENQVVTTRVFYKTIEPAHPDDYHLFTHFGVVNGYRYYIAGQFICHHHRFSNIGTHLYLSIEHSRYKQHGLAAFDDKPIQFTLGFEKAGVNVRRFNLEAIQWHVPGDTSPVVFRIESPH